VRAIQNFEGPEEMRMILERLASPPEVTFLGLGDLLVPFHLHRHLSVAFDSRILRVVADLQVLEGLVAGQEVILDL
jgi:hypothetical protein